MIDSAEIRPTFVTRGFSPVASTSVGSPDGHAPPSTITSMSEPSSPATAAASSFAGWPDLFALV